MPSTVRSRHRNVNVRLGFTLQKPWRTLAIVAIVVAISVAAIMPIVRARRSDARRRAGLRTLVSRVIARQAPRDTLSSGYAGAFPIALIPRSGQRVTRWVADSASWSVSITDDSMARGERSCGAYHGTLARPLHAGVAKADSVFCW